MLAHTPFLECAWWAHSLPSQKTGMTMRSGIKIIARTRTPSFAKCRVNVLCPTWAKSTPSQAYVLWAGRLLACLFPVERFASLHFVALLFASPGFTLRHFASLRFASLRLASLRFASLRFSSDRVASLRFASLRFALLRCALLHCVSPRLASLTFCNGPLHSA